MCGIAGIACSRLAEEESQAALTRMSEELRHRGPDGSALRHYPAAKGAFAIRRLALLDLVTGGQPIANEDETVHAIVNGEIYNHRELRWELERTGHRFRTATDVEVVLHLYEQHGAAGIGRLNGMFAFAILDVTNRRLILARDPAGMKPLYYASTRSGFLFASEPGALLASGLVEKAPDWDGLDTYLAAGYSPAPRTCFRGISKLKAGHYLIVENEKAREETYWQPGFRSGRPRPDEHEYADELEHLLRGAVRSHLDADVPVGAFISGGWDSSLVGLLAAQMSPKQLKTFSIVFPDHPGADESRYSRVLAQRVASDHHEIEFRAEDVPRVLPAAIRRLGEPCRASPSLLLYHLSSVAASSVKAVVGGEGSDEQFAGYSWLQWRSELHYWLRRVAPRGPFHFAGQRATHLEFGRMARVISASDELAADGEWHRVFSPSEHQALFTASTSMENPDIRPLRLDPETEATCRNRLERRLALEFTRRLPEGILLVADRMGMAHSLEIRMPFLDAKILEFSARLPAHMRRKGRQEKYILSLLKGLLPAPIARRRKFGLIAPMQRYLAGPLREWARQTLLDSSCLGGHLDRARLEIMLKRWLNDGDRYGRRPWGLILLQTWWDQYFSN